MKTPTNNPILRTGLIICALLIISCAETKKEETVVEEQEIPLLEAASQEYANIVQKTLELMSTFEHDAYGEHMADDIIWYWPDGDSNTRHTIKGKNELISWWKNWQETTGGKMTFTNTTFLPIKVNKPSNYYKLVGTGVLSYVDLTISLQDKSTSVRQHIVFMFNDDKKITHALLYYDRTGIIELTNVVLGESE